MIYERNVAKGLAWLATAQRSKQSSAATLPGRCLWANARAVADPACGLR